MSADEPTEDNRTRRLVDRSVALRAGTLHADCQALLDHARPQWQCEAANLIAEGVRAYVMVETVEPDLARDKEVDPHDTTSAEELAARPGAHMIYHSGRCCSAGWTHPLAGWRSNGRRQQRNLHAETRTLHLGLPGGA
jgi:hypothetical protein